MKRVPRSIILVSYDPSWPRLYEKEKDRILQAIGDRVVEIEHIGSTAIPGLKAKPIIDIAAGLIGQNVADSCLHRLREIGYDDVTLEPKENDWYYCLGKVSRSIGYHLHLMKSGSQFYKKHILFRDYLRSHPADAIRYQELKESVASTYGDNRIKYTDAKTVFIDSIVEKAIAS